MELLPTCVVCCQTAGPIFYMASCAGESTLCERCIARDLLCVQKKCFLCNAGEKHTARNRPLEGVFSSGSTTFECPNAVCSWRGTFKELAKHEESVCEHSVAAATKRVYDDGLSLRDLSEENRCHPPICWAAVRQNPSAYEFIGDNMKDEKPLASLACTGNGMMLEFAGDSVRSNLGLVCTAVLQNFSAIRFADLREFWKCEPLVELVQEKIHTGEGVDVLLGAFSSRYSDLHQALKRNFCIWILQKFPGVLLHVMGEGKTEGRTEEKKVWAERFKNIMKTDAVFEKHVRLSHSQIRKLPLPVECYKFAPQTADRIISLMNSSIHGWRFFMYAGNTLRDNERVFKKAFRLKKDAFLYASFRIQSTYKFSTGFSSVKDGRICLVRPSAVRFVRIVRQQTVQRVREAEEMVAAGVKDMEEKNKKVKELEERVKILEKKNKKLENARMKVTVVISSDEDESERRPAKKARIAGCPCGNQNPKHRGICRGGMSRKPGKK